MNTETLSRKDEAPGSPQTERFTDQEAQHPDSATGSRAEPVSLAKPEASLQAEFALAGYELQKMRDGSFVVAKWGMVRALPSLDDAIQFGKQAGVRHG